MPHALRSTTIVLPLLAVAALSGCGGGDAGAGDIASLGTTATTTTADGDDGDDGIAATADDDTGDGNDTDDVSDTSDTADDGDGGDDGDDGGPGGRAPGVVVMRGSGNSDDPALQEAQVEYARCMREHGIDMPDPSPESEETRIEIDDPDAWQEAEEACRSILEEVVGEFEAPSEEEQARMREEALEFAKCMREHGIDMPDPVFGEDGGVTVDLGSERGPDGGGPDPQEFEAAAEECGGIGDGAVFGSADSDSSESD